MLTHSNGVIEGRKKDRRLFVSVGKQEFMNFSAHSLNCGWISFWETEYLCANVCACTEKEKHIFVLPYEFRMFLSHAQMKCPVDYLMSIEAYCIICSHRTWKNLRLELQEAEIGWSNFWNRQIVCLHASICFGTGCTFLPRFLVKNRKMRGKEAVVWNKSRRISCL